MPAASPGPDDPAARPRSGLPTAGSGPNDHGGRLPSGPAARSVPDNPAGRLGSGAATGPNPEAAARRTRTRSPATDAIRDAPTGPELDLRIRVRRATGARPDRATLRRVCQNVLRGEGVAGPAYLTLAIVADDEIHQLNRRHRGVDRPTDVLSFSLVDPAVDERGFVTPPDQPAELGDIVVSYARVLVQAEEYGHSPERELAYLVAHGLLHILGHDHEQAEERTIMREREEAALRPLGLIR